MDLVHPGPTDSSPVCSAAAPPSPRKRLRQHTAKAVHWADAVDICFIPSRQELWRREQEQEEQQETRRQAMLAILEAEIEAYQRRIAPLGDLQWTTWTSPSGSSTELPLPVLPELPLPPGFEELFGDLEPVSDAWASSPWASAEGSHRGSSARLATLPRSRGFMTFEPQQVMQPVS